jgi:hypothetical protein
MLPWKNMLPWKRGAGYVEINKVRSHKTRVIAANAIKALREQCLFDDD